MQRRMQKILMGRGIILWHMVSFVFSARCLWRHNLTSFSCFQTNVLAAFLDIICTIFCTQSLYFCVIALNMNYQPSRLGYWRKKKLNATTQQFITAKISDCEWKQGRKRHSSMRKNNLQLQNEVLCADVKPNFYKQPDAQLVEASQPFERLSLDF